MGVAYGIGRVSSRYLMPFAWRKPPWDAVLELLIATFTMLLLAHNTGWGKPVARAFSLQLLWLTSRVFEQKPKLLWIFTISLTISFFLGRGSMLSFLLSGLSMLAIIMVRENNELKERPILKYFLYLTAPWLITLPVTAFVFQSASLFAPIYNLLFTPLFGFLTVLPLILSLVLKTIGLSTASTFFYSCAEFASTLLLRALNKCEEWLGGGMSVSNSAFYLFFLLAPIFFIKSKLIKRIFCGCAILLILMPQNFSVAFLNIGQGDAILLRDEKETILMDTGRPNGRALKELLRLNATSLEHLFLTHPDSDHIGGVPQILAQLAVKKAWISPEHLALKKILPTLATLEQHQVPIYFWTARQVVKNLTCIKGPGITANDMSPLCKFTFPDGTQLLLTGDLSAKAEKWFIQRSPSFLRAEMLKVAHHGSRYSSSSEFLDLVGPASAIISVGHNRYGHPHESVITRLEARRIRILRTDQNGTINASSAR